MSAHLQMQKQKGESPDRAFSCQPEVADVTESSIKLSINGVTVLSALHRGSW